MVDWLKIRDKNGDTYLINADNIIYIDKDGIVLRGWIHLKAQVDVEDVERAIAESRKKGEMIDGEGAVRELTNAEIVRWIDGN